MTSLLTGRPAILSIFLISMMAMCCLSCTSARDQVAGEGATTAQPTRAANSSLCPDLTGLYSEGGQDFNNGAKTQDVAHLTWLLGEKEKTALTPLSTWPAPGRPSIFFVSTVRVSHPSVGHFALEAFDADGKGMGKFQFGPEDGWTCDGESFVIFRTLHGGGEGSWGDDEGTHRLYRGADGALVRSIYSRYQKRTIFLLGAPIGSPMVMNIEYRFPLLSK
jgi:hypothetical protein